MAIPAVVTAALKSGGYRLLLGMSRVYKRRKRVIWICKKFGMGIFKRDFSNEFRVIFLQEKLEYKILEINFVTNNS
jgi:hypothetical protein